MEGLSTQEWERLQDILKNLGENFHRNQVGRAVRGLGLNPSEKHLTSLLVGVDGDELNQKDFIRFYKQCKEISFREEEIRRQFGLLDKNNDKTIDVNDLKEVLKQSQEPLTEEEVQEFFEDFPGEEGKLNLETLLNKLFASA